MGSTTAVRRHREILAATRRAAATWAAERSGSRDLVAASIIQLLADCANDIDGNKTLDAVSSVFEEHANGLSPSVADALQQLAHAAHVLGKTRTLRLEH
jgi:hypothetical protein